jgi:hypothetical protein
VSAAACPAPDDDRRIDLRHFIDMPPAIVESERISEQVQIVNIARMGFLAKTRLHYRCGETLTLHFANVPPLESVVIWSDKGMLGGRFIDPVEIALLSRTQESDGSITFEEIER